jgi:hypothetical protein
MPGQREMILNLEAFDQRPEVLIELRDRNVKTVEVPFQPGEKDIAARVQMIVAMQDAAMVRHQELRYRRDDAFARKALRSAQEQDGGVHFYGPIILG